MQKWEYKTSYWTRLRRLYPEKGMKTLWGLLCATLVLIHPLVAVASAPSTNRVVRIAVDAIGREPGDLGYYPDVSGNGRYVAFTSKSPDLVDGDTNACTDVFVYDRFTQIVDRVSISSIGEEAADGCGSPSISDDGRYVAFVSWADNLVAGMPGGETHQDTFVHDRQTGVTVHASPSLSGGWGYGYRPTISGDGKTVVFSSGLGNLVSGDTNNESDVFVRDLEQETTTRVSLDPHGDQFRSSSVLFPNSLSRDGQRVLFLVDGKIYVHDRASGTTQQIDRSGWSGWPSISRSGLQISHDTWHAGLPPGYAIEIVDIDLGTSLHMISQAGDPDYSGNPPCSALSYTAEKVIFDSVDGAVAGDTNEWTDIHLYDSETETRAVVSREDVGVQANGNSMWPCISDDGRIVAFVSYASNLVPGDTNGVADVFMYDGTDYRYHIELPLVSK